MLLLAVGCRARIQPERQSLVYAGIGAAVSPDVGFTVTGGQLMRERERFDFAFEMRASRQGSDDSPTQDGKFVQIQAGVKQTASPGHPRRLFFKYGATWLRANGDPKFIDVPGDYFGVFGSVGYDIDLSERWTLSPEFQLTVVDGEGSTGSEVIPQGFLTLLFRF